MIKHAILRICGNAQHTGADSPLLPVRGFTEHLQFSALFTGRKSRRAAAIQIQGCYAASIFQDRCHLIIIHTNGPRCQAPLRHEKYNAAVRPNADAVSRIHSPIAGLLDHPVFQQVKRARHRFHDIICRRTRIADHCGAICQNRKIRFVRGLDYIPFHDKITRRFAGSHIEIVTVGRHDHCTFRICDGTIVSCQLRGFLHAPLTIPDCLGVAYTLRLGTAFRIISVIGSLQLYIFCQIDLRHITNRLMVILIPHNDLIVCHPVGNGVVRL